jgi:tetratricopeptide (TPR) repeat protein
MNATRPPRPGGRARPGGPAASLTLALAALVAALVSTGSGCATYSNGTPEAKDLVKKAQTSYRAGDYKDAVEKCELALRLDPLYAYAMAYLGIACHKNGWSERGIKEVEQAIKLHPDLADAYDNLGEIYIDLGRLDDAEKQFLEAKTTYPGYDDVDLSPNFNLGRVYLAQGKDDKALACFEEATRNNAKFVEAHLAAGSLYLKNGVKKDAEQHFKLAIEYDPKNHIAAHGLGRLALAQEQWEEAIRRFKAALAILPNEPTFKRSLEEAYKKSPPRVARTLVETATAARDQGKVEEAYSDLEAAGRIDPKLVDVYVLKAQVLLMMQPKQVEEASKVAKAGYALDPKNRDMRFQYAYVMLEQKSYKGAEDLLRGLRKEVPSAPKYHKYLGIAFFKQRQFRRAEREWLDVRKLDPKDEQVVKYLDELLKSPNMKKSSSLNDEGAKLLGRGDFEGARECFRQAVEIDDQFAIAHANLALAHLELGDLKEARRRAKLALERDPDLAHAFLLLGIIDMREQKLDDAMKRFVACSELNVADPEPHYYRGMIFMEQKRPKDAENAFETALEIQPDHFKSQHQIALIYLGKGLIEKAEVRLKLAIKSGPEYIPPRAELARLYLRQKRYEEAKEHLEKAHQIDPTAPDPWLGFAEVQKALGETAKSQASLLEAADRYAARRQYVDAVRICRQAVALDGSSAKAHSFLGIALMNTAQVTEAIAELTKADQLEPENLIHRMYIGLCHKQKGDRKRAADSFREILRANPGNYTAMEMLADLYDEKAEENQVSLKETIELLEKALKLEQDEARKDLIRARLEELRKLRK